MVTREAIASTSRSTNTPARFNESIRRRSSADTSAESINTRTRIGRAGVRTPARPIRVLVLMDSAEVSALDRRRIDSLKRAGVLVERDVDAMASLVTMDALHYPDDLRRARVEGRVILRCVVGPNGRAEPRTIFPVEPGDLAFINAARDALHSAIFSPARVNGVPVRSVVTMPFDFKIRGAR